MTNQLDPQSLLDLISYRLQRASETLKEAQYNAKGGFFNTAVNRLYYACYYAATALLIANRYEANSHKGVKVMLGLHFIRTGYLEIEYGNIYQQLFNNRMAGDYEDFIYCDNDLFNELYPKAEAFVTRITNLIHNPIQP